MRMTEKHRQILLSANGPGASDYEIAKAVDLSLLETRTLLDQLVIDERLKVDLSRVGVALYRRTEKGSEPPPPVPFRRSVERVRKYSAPPRRQSAPPQPVPAFLSTVGDSTPAVVSPPADAADTPVIDVQPIVDASFDSELDRLIQRIAPIAMLPEKIAFLDRLAGIVEGRLGELLLSIRADLLQRGAA